MPTYEFRCPNGHEFERFYKTISAGVAELPCPECGAVAQRQLSGGAGLVFKGSGFYLTDYGKNAHRGSAPAKKTDDKSDGKSDKKSDEKPDKKADVKSDSRAEAPKTQSSEPKAASEPKAESPKPKKE